MSISPEPEMNDNEHGVDNHNKEEELESLLPPPRPAAVVRTRSTSSTKDKFPIKVRNSFLTMCVFYFDLSPF